MNVVVFKLKARSIDISMKSSGLYSVFVELIFLNLARQLYFYYIFRKKLVFSYDLFDFLHQTFLGLSLRFRIEMLDEPKIGDIQYSFFSVCLWSQHHKSNKFEHRIHNNCL